MTPALTAYLRDLTTRCERATKGPWRRADDQPFYRPDSLRCVSALSPGQGERILLSANPHFAYEEDLEFIAHAREDLPRLVRLVRELSGAIDKARRESASDPDNRWARNATIILNEALARAETMVKEGG